MTPSVSRDGGPPLPAGEGWGEGRSASSSLSRSSDHPIPLMDHPITRSPDHPILPKQQGGTNEVHSHQYFARFFSREPVSFKVAAS